MSDTQTFFLLAALVALLGGRHAAIGTAVDNWVRLCMGRKSISEAVADDTRAGRDAVLSLYMHLAIEPNQYPQLKEALLPPFYLTKTGFYWLADLALCVAAFFVLPWYFAIGFPIVLFVAIRVSYRVSRALGNGFKNRIIAGLTARREVETKMGTAQTVAMYSGLIEAIKNTNYKP